MTFDLPFIIACSIKEFAPDKKGEKGEFKLPKRDPRLFPTDHPSDRTIKKKSDDTKDGIRWEKKLAISNSGVIAAFFFFFVFDVALVLE